jgi:hypothetical protein
MTIHVSYLPDENGIRSIFNEFYNNQEPPEGALKITKEELDNYLDILNRQQKSLWIDAKDIIQVRDRLTKWNKKKKTFVPDEDAIIAEKRHLLKSQADKLIKDYVIYTMPYYFNKYTTQQQKELTDYLDALHNEKITELPIKPDFLG